MWTRDCSVRLLRNLKEDDYQTVDAVHSWLFFTFGKNVPECLHHVVGDQVSPEQWAQRMADWFATTHDRWKLDEKQRTIVP